MDLGLLLPLLLLCASIGLVLVAYLWLVWYISLYHTPRPLEDNCKPPKLQQGLSEADLQRLPTIECRNEEGKERNQGGGDDDCAVCLEPFQIGDRCRVIPACSHAFHVHCADAWLSKLSVCPICRRSARENESEEEKFVIVNINCDAAQEDEVRDEESGRSLPPPATLESVVVLKATATCSAS